MYTQRLDLTEATKLGIRPGETWRLRVPCVSKDTKKPYDFTGAQVSASLMDKGALVRAFTVVIMPLGVLDVSMQTGGLMATKTATWRLEVLWPNGDTHYLIEGLAHVGGFKP